VPREAVAVDRVAFEAGMFLKRRPPACSGASGRFRELVRSEELAHLASIGDLARMLAALGREQDVPPLHQLRTLAELERSLIRQIGR
jgi:hypothetical protein